MTYVIAYGCCNDASCIPACPVDCIRPRPGDPDFMTAEQLYIDPASCTDCSACVNECPVGAIHDEHDIPAELDIFREINAAYFEKNPLDLAEPKRRVKPVAPERQPLLRVAVVGAGPAGCYVTGELASLPFAEVSVLDRLPTPHGLLRAGVAPDHQGTKAIAGHFDRVLKRRNVSCYFNVDVGVDVTIEDLLGVHHAVVLTVGADAGRKPGIPGEDLRGTATARDFVSWYNGHPEYAHLDFDLGSERVVVVGNGNVALDVARVLTTPPDELAATDIADHALEALRRTAVREVVVAARRDASHSAFTTPELHALMRTGGIDVLAEPSEVQSGAGRKAELIREAAALEPTTGNRAIRLRYLLTPSRVNGDAHVESITFGRTTGEEETMPTSLVVFATGYLSSGVPGIPLDAETGVVPNKRGRVVDPVIGYEATRLYCAGWVKRGAVGAIGSNRVCAQETVASLLEDFEAGRLADPPELHTDVAAMVAARVPAVVGYAGWAAIDKAERARGRSAEPRRPRVKMTRVEELLGSAGQRSVI